MWNQCSGKVAERSGKVAERSGKVAETQNMYFSQNLDSEYIELKKSENKSPARVFFSIALSIHVWPVFKKFKANWLVVGWANVIQLRGTKPFKENSADTTSKTPTPKKTADEL